MILIRFDYLKYTMIGDLKVSNGSSKTIIKSAQSNTLHVN